jgi:hypothetical protein
VQPRPPHLRRAAPRRHRAPVRAAVRCFQPGLTED